MAYGDHDYRTQREFESEFSHTKKAAWIVVAIQADRNACRFCYVRRNGGCQRVRREFVGSHPRQQHLFPCRRQWQIAVRHLQIQHHQAGGENISAGVTITNAGGCDVAVFLD